MNNELDRLKNRLLNLCFGGKRSITTHPSLKLLKTWQSLKSPSTSPNANFLRGVLTMRMRFIKDVWSSFGWVVTIGISTGVKVGKLRDCDKSQSVYGCVDCKAVYASLNFPRSRAPC